MKQFVVDIVGYLMGAATPALLGACILFACFASAVMHYVRSVKRDQESTRTPPDWSWAFFWKDTRPRIIATFLLILLSIRMLFIWDMADGWYIGFSIIVGLISDRLAKIFEKAADASANLADKKIDEVAGKLEKTEAKVDTVKQDLKDASAELRSIKKEDQ